VARKFTTFNNTELIQPGVPTRQQIAAASSTTLKSEISPADQRPNMPGEVWSFVFLPRA